VISAITLITLITLIDHNVIIAITKHEKCDQCDQCDQCKNYNSRNHFSVQCYRVARTQRVMHARSCYDLKYVGNNTISHKTSTGYFFIRSRTDGCYIVRPFILTLVRNRSEKIKKYFLSVRPWRNDVIRVCSRNKILCVRGCSRTTRNIMM
jgi:hypothetical protein